MEFFVLTHEIWLLTWNSYADLTSRGCHPCGTNSIPYPLSTSSDCGDPSYFNFRCNKKTGQVSFSISKGTFNVSSIDPEAKRFSVQVGHGNWCDTGYLDSVGLSLENSSMFSIKNCSVVIRYSFLDVEQSVNNVEIGWKPPPELACNTSSDCQGWPHTTCKGPRNSTKRCMCHSKFHWDGWNLKCTKGKLLMAPLTFQAHSFLFWALSLCWQCSLFYPQKWLLLSRL